MSNFLLGRTPGLAVASLAHHSGKRDPPRMRSEIPALAFVAGFADASSFCGAGGVFCAHVTGNFVVLAADLARGAQADEWVKLATFPIFVAAIALATKLSFRGPRALLWTSAGLLVLAAVVGAFDAPARPFARVAVVSLLVLAMGVQNAMHRLEPALGPTTTVMTGNVTGFLIEVLRPAPEAAAKHRLAGHVIASFALGCAAGAFGVTRFGFGSLALAAAITLLVASRARAARAEAPAAPR